MKTVLLADYLGGSDVNGNPLGHTNKVIEEYSEYLRGEYNVAAASTQEVISRITLEQRIVLPHSIETKITSSIIYKVRYRTAMLRNIDFIMNTEYPIIWFVNTNLMLYIYLLLFGKKEKKIICTMFQNDYAQGKMRIIRNAIFNLQIQKIDLIISSNNRFHFKNESVFYMPDYLYSEKYSTYRMHKKEQIVILGTIDKRKDVLRYIDQLKNSGMRVVIAGPFLDDEYYGQVSRNESSSITVINKYLEYEEYYKYLSESLYVLLPYDANVYNNRTSGVLIESVFLNTIPIAPRDLLKCNEILGVYIEEFEKNESILKNSIDLSLYYDSYEKLRNGRFNEKSNKDQLLRVISGLDINDKNET